MTETKRPGAPVNATPAAPARPPAPTPARAKTAKTATGIKPPTPEAWDPGKGHGCPVCGENPPLTFRGFDATKPAAYQALRAHMHGVPEVPPSPEFPRGLPSIPGVHPETPLPKNPDPFADDE